jgi:TFIIF-interacting CTD phosphatase-like protein
MNFIKTLFKSGNKSLTQNLANQFTNIQKQESAMADYTDNSYLLRTLIDDSFKSEDVFSSITQQANSKLPDQSKEDKGKLTVFVPMDEILFYSYLPDENMGLYDMPKFKEYDLRIELADYKTFAFIYFRDHLEEFLNFLDEKFEPILYTTGERIYIDKIMNTLDPNNIFRHRLYQEDCHLFKNTKENVIEYLKDINQFTNRNLKRKVLIEFSPLNFVLSPDNSKNIL